ncbi:hypothetical protein ACTU3I_06005 [Microbacterium sp. RD1]|uniref:hypothetical protein n=1 Tax=Microbacterium sp. RD1 TaxID=3457313 RepID=UPI003FA550D3
MKRAAGAAGLAAAALLLTACATSAATASERGAPIGHGEIALVGEWAGADGGGDVRLEVTSAADDGSTFVGALSRAGSASVPVHAAMTPHGHLVAGIGDEASIELHITDPTTLDYCLVTYGYAPDYSCGRLERRP